MFCLWFLLSFVMWCYLLCTIDSSLRPRRPQWHLLLLLLLQRCPVWWKMLFLMTEMTLRSSRIPPLWAIHPLLMQNLDVKTILLISAKSRDQAGMLFHTTKVIRVSVYNPVFLFLDISLRCLLVIVSFSLFIFSITILWGSLLGRSPLVCGSAGSPLTITSMIQALTSPRCAVSLLLLEMTKATYMTG